MKSLTALLLATTCIFANAKYIYQKDINSQLTETTWLLSFDDAKDELNIKGESPLTQTLIVTSPERTIQRYEYHQKNHNTTSIFSRDGHYLHISSLQNSNIIHEKKLKIGNKNWVQAFDFCLRPFIISNGHKYYNFSIVHPEKLSLYDMVATKEGRESLTIGPETYEAVKVKVTLTGLKKMFWHANLWFNSANGDLLKYMANEGPKTPIQTVTLQSKELTNPPCAYSVDVKQ